MYANREKLHVEWSAVPYLLIFFALALCSVAEVGAQAEVVQESPGDVGERAAIRARQHLESALASEDGNVRFPALRVARFMNEPWMADFALPYCLSPDLVERILALDVVTRANPALGRDVFLEALTSGEGALRLRGLLGLGALGDPNTISDLARILSEDLDPDLQAAAARALGDVGDIKASVPLHEAIENEYFPVREQAVLALVAIGDDSLGEYLIDRLQNEHYPGEEETLRLMALVPDPALIAAIEPYLTNENSRKRTLAAAAILSILERSGNAHP